ncbi:MAG: GWxTD domain-containing protein [Bacteroidota bacterium]|nr:GWxTD domain-containing protein [Bacteroidota bacterium]
MKKFFLFTLLVVNSISLFAQQQNSSFRLNYDIARYRGDEQHSYVETYYAFDVSQLKYTKDSTGYQSQVLLSITFKRSSDDSIAERQAWRIPFSISDTAMLQTSRMYVDVFGFMLKPEIYRVYIVASNLTSPSIRDSVSFVIDIPLIPSDKPALSDVELCSSIQQIEKDSLNRFYKNTFEVKPNPSKIFGTYQPALFYYLEAYNLKLQTSEKYYTKAVILNAVGKEVVNREKAKNRTYDSNVEVGMVKVNALRTGVYTFKYVIYDSTDRSEYSNSKRFFVYNPNLPNDTLVSATDGSIDATVFATMTEEELDKEFLQLRYIASKNEIQQYSKLNGVDAKRRAVYSFWESRDEDHTTAFNETRQEYLRRIAYANVQYKTGFKEGWKTDRGRVYIVYGPPDEVERHVNETDVKPYEIWFYNSIQGGVQFIFGDRTGFSDYVLLHSTHRNELRDDNWHRQIEAN